MNKKEKVVFKSLCILINIFILLSFFSFYVFATDDKNVTSNIEVSSETEQENLDSDEDILGHIGITSNGKITSIIGNDTKEVYSFTTNNGRIYYILIDKARQTNNVYLLSAANEEDLYDFTVDTETEEVKTTTTTTETSTETVLIDEEGNIIEAEEPIETETTEVEESIIEEPVDNIETVENKSSNENNGIRIGSFVFSSQELILFIIIIIVIIIFIVILILLIKRSGRKRREREEEEERAKRRAKNKKKSKSKSNSSNNRNKTRHNYDDDGDEDDFDDENEEEDEDDENDFDDDDDFDE